MRDFSSPGRSTVYADNGMIATSHPMASSAGLDVLKAGGNAVDAALAAAAILNVVEPHMTGIGGDCFALVSDPRQNNQVTAYSGAGRAPAATDVDALRAAGLTSIPGFHPAAVTIPASIATWVELAENVGRFPLERALRPAAALARDGFRVAPRVASDWAKLEAKLRQHPHARQQLLKNDAAPKAGDRMTLPQLANTFDAVADGGLDAFYSGWVADDLVATLNALGGVHTLEDFARADHCQQVETISGPFAGLDVVELPPGNQGILALMMLNMLERLIPDPSRVPALSAKRYHLMMEAARLAYTARDAHLADPTSMRAPVEHLLSDALADELAARIDPSRRTADLGPVPESSGGNTIYLTVVDRDGMACSFINSVYSSFGSAIVGEKSGVWLHNRGQGFTLEAGHANELAPNKRPMHTLAPAMATTDGKPSLSFGVMGADFQPMGHVYVLTNMQHYGMDPQAALDFPRVFLNLGGQPGGTGLLVEPSVPSNIAGELMAMGHTVAFHSEAWGGGQVIQIDHDRGVLIGGSDPRKDGIALGY